MNIYAFNKALENMDTSVTDIISSDEALRIELEEGMEQYENGMFMKHEDFMKQIDSEFPY